MTVRNIERSHQGLPLTSSAQRNLPADLPKPSEPNKDGSPFPNSCFKHSFPKCRAVAHSDWHVYFRSKAAFEGYVSNNKNTIGAAFARQLQEKPPEPPIFDERERWQRYFKLTTMPPCEMVKMDPLVAARTMALRSHFRRLLDGSTKMDSYRILADDLQLSERHARRVKDVFVENEHLLQSARGRYVRRLNVFNNEEVREKFQSHCAQQEKRLEIDELRDELNNNIIPAVYSTEDQAKMKLVSRPSHSCTVHVIKCSILHLLFPRLHTWLLLCSLAVQNPSLTVLILGNGQNCLCNPQEAWLALWAAYQRCLRRWS
jgi:hypothetical protein